MWVPGRESNHGVGTFVNEFFSRQCQVPTNGYLAPTNITSVELECPHLHPTRRGYGIVVVIGS